MNRSYRNLFFLFTVLGFASAVTCAAAAEDESPSVEQAVEEASSTKGPLKRSFGFDASGDNEPLYVKSLSLKLNTKTRTFIYKGNVEVIRGDLVITADVITGNYNENDEIDTINCDDNVVITRGEGLRSSSDRALYRVAEGTVELTENPELYHHGNALTADKVTLFLEEDRSEAEGNVRVKVIKPNDSVDAAAGE